MTSRRRIATILVAAFAGVLLRVIIPLSAPSSFHGTDAEQYWLIAKNLAGGRGYSGCAAAPFQPDLMRSPGYPSFLASFILVVGENPIPIAAFQIWLDIVTGLWLAVSIAKKIGRDELSAPAFGLFCILPYAGGYGASLFSEALLIPLLQATLAFAVTFPTERPRSAAGLAVLLVALTYTRPVFLPAILLAILILACRSAFRSAFVMMLASILLLSPWSMRNHSLCDSWNPAPPLGMSIVWYRRIVEIGMRPSLSDESYIFLDRLWHVRESPTTPEEFLAAEARLRQVCREIVVADPLTYASGTARQFLHIWFGQPHLLPIAQPNISPIAHLALRIGAIFTVLLSFLALQRWREHWLAFATGFSPLIATAVVSSFFHYEARFLQAHFGTIAILAAAAFFVPRRK